MKEKIYPVQNSPPLFVENLDVLGQPKGVNFLQRFKPKSINTPDLKVTYAGLGIRTIAKLIDISITFSPLLILESFLFKFNYMNVDFNSYRFFTVVFIWIFYNSVFEASVYQATIGKMILKLKVIDLYGKRISVLRSFFRCITIIISILPVGFGIWYITTDPKKRAWHDLILGTYVIES
ncbi:MAG: RDD family protein [Bacteroidota bacterium]